MPLKYVPIVNSVTKTLKNAKDEVVNRSELVRLSKISVNAILRTGKIDAVRWDTFSIGHINENMLRTRL